MFHLMLLCVCASPLSGEKIARPAAFPWKLDTAYKYLWSENGRRTGEIVFRFGKQTEASGLVYRLTSRRRRTQAGLFEDASGKLFFNPDKTPISYTEEVSVGRGRTHGGKQEVRVKFSPGRAKTITINNGDTSKAISHEFKIPRGCHLYQTLALEQWTLLAMKLRGSGEQTLNIFYPQLGRIYRLVFAPSKEIEMVKIGRKTLKATRYHFEYRSEAKQAGGAKKTQDDSLKGIIWVDAQGRLIKYASGSLQLILGS